MAAKGPFSMGKNAFPSVVNFILMRTCTSILPTDGKKLAEHHFKINVFKVKYRGKVCI